MNKYGHYNDSDDDPITRIDIKIDDVDVDDDDIVIKLEKQTK